MWKTLSFKQKGISHKQSNTCCQDNVCISQDDRWIVAALADGLGSLRNSEVAAEAATNTVCDFPASLLEKIIKRGNGIENDVIAAVTDSVKEKAAGLSIPVSELDCTLVFVVVDKKSNDAAVGRLGDSAALIIRESDSMVISDSDHSANGTNAILDTEASKHLYLQTFDLERDGIVGIILTSDGLDNELYLKGSKHVQRIAGLYFNAVSVSKTEEDAKKVIEERISKLTEATDSQFDDDISLAVLSRIDFPIEMQDDPTWLCSCGARNYLQQTYCHKCHKDFSILYQDIRFRDYGGKDAFFTRINKRPNEERELAGLPPVRIEKKADSAIQGQPTVKPTTISDSSTHSLENHIITPSGQGASQETILDSELKAPLLPRTEQGVGQNRSGGVKNHGNSQTRTTGNASISKKIKQSGVKSNKHFRLPKPTRRLLPFVICLIVGLVLGLILNRISSSRKIKSLNEQVDDLQQQVSELSSELRKHGGDVKETEPPAVTSSPLPTENPSDTPTETPIPTPSAFVVLDDGDFYWGPSKENVPEGFGILLHGGLYYIGNFDHGSKNGKFVIVDSSDMSKIETVEFKDDVPITDASPTPAPSSIPSNTPSNSPDHNTSEPSQTPGEPSFGTYHLRSEANLRKEPGLNSEVICKLEAGSEVQRISMEEISADGHIWVKVKTSDNFIGWISKHFLI